MTHRFAEIAFTESVRSYQNRLGTLGRNEQLKASGGPNDRLGTAEVDFIGMQDSFYMASVSDTGWPYVQHRGGPIGFLRVIDQRTIGFADFRGNTQYVTTGNLSHDDRVALILMDYRKKRRLKLFGRVRLVEAADNPMLITQLESPEYRARTERAFIIAIEGFDWNCPQHITMRLTEMQISEWAAPLHIRIQQLEEEINCLRNAKLENMVDTGRKDE
jgi:predicted pyridoxine 5'-phosphate oxidase superfamily flavin-nucleotide-binding protein